MPPLTLLKWLTLAGTFYLEKFSHEKTAFECPPKVFVLQYLGP